MRRNTGGRPRKPPFVRELVLRMARENDWGFTRIAAEIRNLHIGPIGRTTVRNILNAGGVEPGPHRSTVTWDTFLKRHFKTLWACDFLSVRSWTMRGRVELHLLVFIHLSSRRVIVSPATRNPDAAWVEQQARNFTIQLEESGEDCSFVLRDRDSKYTPRFDAIVRRHTSRGPMCLPICSPNLNAYAERFVQTLKHECLNHFVVFGERHLDHLVGEFADYYHTKRPHQGLGNATPVRCRGAPPVPPAPGLPGAGPVKCESRLGGLLKHYYCAAA